MVGCFAKGSKMDPRSLCLIVISVGIAGFVNFVLTNPIMDSLESSSEIAKVFLDCKHSDYRTYIQCLKREKRHPYGYQNMDPACLETCVPNCLKLNHACEDSCKHCLRARKTRNRIINITESETEMSCTSGNCTKTDEHKPVVVNVTNHIHIHNYYNKTTESKPPNPTTCPCYHITWQPCYCRPQYQICQYQQQWPCVPYGGYGGGFSGGGYGQIGVGIVEVPSVIGSIGSIGATSSNCVCPNQTTRCDECNPPVG